MWCELLHGYKFQRSDILILYFLPMFNLVPTNSSTYTITFPSFLFFAMSPRSRALNYCYSLISLWFDFLCHTFLVPPFFLPFCSLFFRTASQRAPPLERSRTAEVRGRPRRERARPPLGSWTIIKSQPLVRPTATQLTSLGGGDPQNGLLFATHCSRFSCFTEPFNYLL